MAYLQPYLNTPLPSVSHAILPTPALTGNIANCHKIFRAADGSIYYVDHLGNSLKLESQAMRTLVPLGTGVTLEDVTITPASPQGFLLSSPTPGWQYDIAAFGCYNLNNVRASNRQALIASATPTQPFAWVGFTPADMVHGIIQDTSNSRVYSFAVTLGALCYVEIERKL